MSAANASAIRRRAGTNPSPSPSPLTSSTSLSNQANNQINPPSQKGLTIQQVISNFDSRLKELENRTPIEGNFSSNSSSVFNSEIVEEYNSRFEIIANELADLKNALLKLQTFTMDVNKSLHDERIRVLSDIDNTDTNINFDVENTESIIENKNLGKENNEEQEQPNKKDLTSEDSIVQSEISS